MTLSAVICMCRTGFLLMCGAVPRMRLAEYRRGNVLGQLPECRGRSRRTMPIGSDGRHCLKVSYSGLKETSQSTCNTEVYYRKIGCETTPEYVVCGMWYVPVWKRSHQPASHLRLSTVLAASALGSPLGRLDIITLPPYSNCAADSTGLEKGFLSVLVL